jgi:hypothetical protein
MDPEIVSPKLIDMGNCADSTFLPTLELAITALALATNKNTMVAILTII